ncbi:MAG: hypothetical protein HC782_04655 [Gammaproteobacteria bacterium]|nr:hypothetical protein [Gammaproteobacteria bacterium]
MNIEDKPEDGLTAQVDALIGKHAVVADERNIPVLTDLIDAPDWVPPLTPMSPTTPAAEVTNTEILDTFTEDEIDALSQDIFTRVSEQIDAELATKLQARLSEQLQMQLNTAITNVLADMKLSIANEIGDAVNAALADRLRHQAK